MNEAELAFCHILNCDRLSLYLNKDSFLAQDKSALVSSVLKRRICGEPIQYILGKAEFMGLEFKVTPDVFIPRPETEVLVETVVKYVTRAQEHKSTRLNILDLGTGSGCIAISLAKFLPEAKITATDISHKALEVAKKNARLNSVNINFIQADLFNTPNSQLITHNLIVTNPPYIPTEEIDKLQPELQYEPRIALDGGRDGLDFFRQVVSKSVAYLKEDGFLLMEIGYNQAGAVKNILQNSKNFEIIELAKDYNNIDRVIVAKRIGKNG